MPGVNPTDVLGSGDLTPPPGIELRTTEQRELFRASLEFERFFLQHMLKQMDAATKALKSEDDTSGGGSTSAYSDMAQDSMVQSMLDSGGLGIAASLYEQMAEASGIDQGGDQPPADAGGDA